MPLIDILNSIMILTVYPEGFSVFNNIGANKIPLSVNTEFRYIINAFKLLHSILPENSLSANLLFSFNSLPPLSFLPLQIIWNLLYLQLLLRAYRRKIRQAAGAMHNCKFVFLVLSTIFFITNSPLFNIQIFIFYQIIP